MQLVDDDDNASVFILISDIDNVASAFEKKLPKLVVNVAMSHTAICALSAIASLKKFVEILFGVSAVPLMVTLTRRGEYVLLFFMFVERTTRYLRALSRE